MADWNPQANDLFLRAAEIDGPADRQLFVDQNCPDAALRAQVECSGTRTWGRSGTTQSFGDWRGN